MKKYILAMLVLGSAVLGFGQSTEKEREILRLLEITDVKNMAEQIFDMLIPQIQALVPNAPGEFWDRLEENLDFDDFVTAFIPLYDRYYTLEEIRAIIAFYETPAGRKVVQVTPLMTADSMAIGQDWGRRMGLKVLEEMKRSGYLDA